MTNIPCEWIPGHVVIGGEQSKWAVVLCLGRMDPQQRTLGGLNFQAERTARIQVVTKWLHTQGWVALPLPATSSVAVYMPSERDLTMFLLKLNMPRVEFRETLQGQFTIHTKHSVFDSLVSNELIKPPTTTTKRQNRKKRYLGRIERLRQAVDENSDGAA